MHRSTSWARVAVGLALGASICLGQQAVDLKTLESAKITLERALEIAGHHGKPISAKFEIEDGKLQLSVYTAKGGKFSEVIVDHQTGKVAKVDPITGGEDLKAAQAQSSALGQGKTSLEAATRKALKENPGSRVVSVFPSMEAGHAVATVTLAGNQGTKTVSEGL
jgi:uncharacterized membrane protein YkoI